MVETAYKQIIPVLPAFKMYEQAMVEWLGGVFIFREGKQIESRVEYAGGEKAVRTIEAMSPGHSTQNKNDRVQNPLITIKMVDCQYNPERYHPPESPWGVIYNGTTKENSTAAARLAKPVPYKVTYEWQMYTIMEEDQRFMMGQVMNRFHQHGGLDYIRFLRSDGLTEWFPMRLQGFNPTTDSNSGEEDRTVRAVMLVELEAYLPLPYTFVPIFRRYIQQMVVGSDLSPDSALEAFMVDKDTKEYEPWPTDPAAIDAFIP